MRSLEHEKIVQAACGYKHSIALTNSGEIYMWGTYEVGDPDTVIRETTLSFANIRPKKLQPVKPNENTKDVIFVKITAGSYHNAAIDKNGFVYTWGDSSAGCLGHEKTNDRAVPTPITCLNEKKAIDIACGEKFTTVIVANKNASISAKCIREFTQNSIQTFKERLNIINDYNTQKKKIRGDRIKKKLTTSPDDEIRIPITKISEKNIAKQITQFYVGDKETKTEPQDSGNNNDSQPTSMTKLDSIKNNPNDDDDGEDEKVIKQPIKRVQTIHASALVAKKKTVFDELDDDSPAKTSYSPQKTFFSTPVPEVIQPVITNKSIAKAKNISYVFDAVTEEINQKSDYYYEFNLKSINQRLVEDYQQPTIKTFSLKPKLKTMKQVEQDLNKKNHVRESSIIKSSKLKGSSTSALLRPQTGKSNNFALDLGESMKVSMHLQSQEDFYNAKSSVRPTSSYSVRTMRQHPTKVLSTRTQTKSPMFDPIKMYEMTRRHEEAEQRNSALVQRKNQYIHDIAAERNFRIKIVQDKKLEIIAQKKFKIEDNSYKRSTEFKNLSEQMKHRKIYIDYVQKNLIKYIGVEYIVSVMKYTIDVCKFLKINKCSNPIIRQTSWKNC